MCCNYALVSLEWTVLLASEKFWSVEISVLIGSVKRADLNLSIDALFAKILLLELAHTQGSITKNFLQ